MLLKMVLVKQKVMAPKVNNIRKSVLKAFEQINVERLDLSGLTVGITAGSRGISSIVEVLTIIIDMVKKAGGYPVIIPAMGSHGETTEEGQCNILASLGITEKSMSVPIRGSLETVLLGETTNNIPVYCNLNTKKVDRIILVNRVKPHTDFSGKIESGICKMLAVGLGGIRGALTTHQYSLIQGYEETITSIAAYMLKKIPVLFAIGILENWKGETAGIEGMLPEEVITKEQGLLKRAKKLLVKLPFHFINILILDEIGKNISGTSMDTKVVGRIMVKGQKEPKAPIIDRIVVLKLTPESHGNAIGVGLADIITLRLFKSIDIEATSLNSIKSMSPEQGRVPCVVKNDYDAIKSALLTLGAVDLNKVKVVYIKNTSKLELFAVSEGMIDEVAKNSQLEIIGKPEEIRFDVEGNLLNFKGKLL